MTRAARRAEWGARGLIVLSALSGVAMGACGVDGQTPTCGDYPPPYDIRSVPRRAVAWEELASSAAPPYNCTTLPAGFVPGAGGGTAGAPAAGGASGGAPETQGGAGGDGEMTGAGGSEE